ncbi:MAG TPA: hypothetical protein VFU33_01030 [Gaiellaceae bacterium]|nr:hypothetical protein [Gaiellaceae bacterium]
MRRLTAWVGGVIGGAVAYRWWRRRPQDAAEPPSEPPQEQPDERAEELRVKLAESRESDEPPVAEPAEPSPPEPEPPEAVDERRQRVHDEGRAALDEMKSEGAEG